MLVPLELKAIADRHGFLSPDIAIGYRAAAHAREHFDGVEDLRCLVFCNGSGCHAVRCLLHADETGVEVIHHDIGQYRFVFMHEPTQTVLNALARTQVMKMSPCGSEIEDQLRNGGCLDQGAWVVYAELVESMVYRIVAQSVHELFSLNMYRCRPAFSGAGGLLRFLDCQRCGNVVRQDRLYDVEGFVLCAHCAAVLPSWFEDSEAPGWPLAGSPA